MKFKVGEKLPQELVSDLAAAGHDVFPGSTNGESGLTGGNWTAELLSIPARRAPGDPIGLS